MQDCGIGFYTHWTDETTGYSELIPGFTLNCTKSSAAKDHAIYNGINYKLILPRMGGRSRRGRPPFLWSGCARC
ncbi:MAG: hypothetical protein IKN17_12400 [Ruminococcus sp.]|nr:hypothetical protein [Ruminococcus sp.]